MFDVNIKKINIYIYLFLMIIKGKSKVFNFRTNYTRMRKFIIVVVVRNENID